MCLPLARLRPDVIHFEWHGAAVDHLPLYGVWDCAITTSCRGSDISVYPHLPGSEPYASGLPAVFSRVSAVHCVSESLAQEAVAFGLDAAKARVARPAIDPELFAPAESGKQDLPLDEDGHLAVVMVGWLRWEKGYEYALEAVRRLVDDGVPVKLEIVGNVPGERRDAMDEEARIRHTVADLGLERYVRLHGAASSGEILDRLRASDVLLHPSMTEGIPVAVIEAMACERPVVVTDCGGLTEAVSDGIEGFVVQPRDPEGIGSALERLWREPALRRRMGEAGRARVLSDFTLRDEHAVFIEMYRDAVGR
jgi:glycosyltransferase involved in cell wall biosynthesis